MSDDLTIRLADPDRDADAVAGIYRPAVDVSSATFEEDAPDADEMASRMRAILARTPWLVAGRVEWPIRACDRHVPITGCYGPTGTGRAAAYRPRP